VLFVPYLMGERVPDLPEATGALLGLRHGSLDSAVIYRASIEGVSLNLGWGVERMRKLGIRVDSVRLVGGGARNALWRQVLADVLEAPVQALAEPESAALGAALQAAWCQACSSGARTAVDTLAQEFALPSGPAALPGPERGRYRTLADEFRSAAMRTCVAR
jgi:xylulokinase